MSRDFPLGDVLSITTGKLVSRDMMDGIYRVLDYMTGEHLMTHQLPRALDECRPSVLRQHPEFANLPMPESRGEALLAWLEEQETRFGLMISLDPVDSEDHTQIDPIAEFRMMRPETPIIILRLK